MTTLAHRALRTAPEVHQLRIAVVSLLLMVVTAAGWAQTPAPPFDMVGFIQSASVDTPGNPLSGGFIKINNHVIKVPANAIVQMPATALGWGEVFSLAPAAVSAGGTQTGMAMEDAVRLPATFEAHIQGNIVNGQYIAGLIFLSQQALNSGQGFIDAIDYNKGELHVNGTRIQINDPAARFSKGLSPDVRFTIDEDNPTVRSETGYPMCLPRTDPNAPGPQGGGDDPLCPQVNRPKDTGGNYAPIFTTALPGTKGQPDPMRPAPFEVGDYITYAGVLTEDDAGYYVSVYQLIANVGIFTWPGTDPAYVAIDVLLQGTGGVPNPLFPQEATSRVRVEGFSTDPSRTVSIFALDTDCNGNTAQRVWASSFPVDPGPPTGAKKGRFRFVPTGGAFLPPAREVRVRITNATVLPVANGLFSGVYQAPNFTFIFPENLAVGNPPVSLNLGDFVWLVNGIGPWNGAIAGQLTPWPDTTTPATTCTSTGPAPAAPTASAIANPSTATGGQYVALDGTTSTPTSGLAYSWTQSPTDVPQVTLATPNSAIASFFAPLVTSSVTLNFTLTVQNASGISSVNVPVTVNPPPPILSPIASAVASPNPAFSGSTVNLDASGSTDPNTPAQAISFSWSQTGGPQVAITNPGAAVASFTAPTVPNGQSSVSVSFQVTVTNTSGLSSTAGVSVTVNPLLAKPIASATATPNPTPSGGPVVLDGSASSDPNGLVLSYLWQQTGGPAVTLTNVTSAKANFVAPIVPAGQPPATLNFVLTVTDSAGMSATAPVAVYVSPQLDTVAITSAQYRTGKARLTVNASDSVVSQSIVLTCTLDIINPATGQPYSAVMTNLGNGTYTVVFTGTALPGRVTVTSNNGGSATTTNISVRQ